MVVYTQSPAGTFGQHNAPSVGGAPDGQLLTAGPFGMQQFHTFSGDWQVQLRVYANAQATQVVSVAGVQLDGGAPNIHAHCCDCGAHIVVKS